MHVVVSVNCFKIRSCIVSDGLGANSLGIVLAKIPCRLKSVYENEVIVFQI